MCRASLSLSLFRPAPPPLSAAAGAEHWTLAEYKAHVDAFLGAIEQRLQHQTHHGTRGRNADTTKFVWIASHAMPTARDNQIAGSGFRLARHECESGDGA